MMIIVDLPYTGERAALVISGPALFFEPNQAGYPVLERTVVVGSCPMQSPGAMSGRKPRRSSMGGYGYGPARL